MPLARRASALKVVSLAAVATLVLTAAATAQFDADDLVEDLIRDEIEEAVGERALEMLEDEVLGGGESDAAARPSPRPSGPPGPRLVSASDPEAIREALALVGTAELFTDRSGAPRISGRIEGELYRVTFHGCASGDDCRYVEFGVGFAEAEATWEDINAWNAEALFGTAFLDEEGQPRLKMTANLEGGVSVANLDSTIERWRIGLVEFRGYVTR